MKKYLSLISKKTASRCIGILGLTVAGSLLASLWPVQLAELYAAISSGQVASVYQGLIAVAVFGITCLGAEGIAILRRIMLDSVIAENESEAKQKGIEKMLKMPVAYTFNHNSGEKTAQLNQGVAGMSQLIRIFCNDVFATLLTAACTLAQVIVNAPSLLAGVILLYLSATIILSVFQIRSQNGVRERIIKRKTTLDGNICQSVSNLELIRSLNAEAYERERLKPAITGISEAERMHSRCMGYYDAAKQACTLLFQIGILIISLVLIHSGRMEAASVITVCLLFQQLVKPIEGVYRFIDEIASALVKVRVLVDMFSADEDEVFSVQNHDAEEKNGEIVLNDVLITTPCKTRALAHYDSLTIPGNQIVALTGPSGCGKSTLVRCIDRFYPYIRGSVRIFGKPLEAYTQRELTSAIYYMPQNTFFFSGTVRDNLVYGLDRSVSDAELYDALKKACILDPLMEKAMEAGGRTCDVLSLEVTEKGENFSGGQRQRLTLARAFLRRPKIFILDESTANLDGSSMEMVLTNLEHYARKLGAGILYISHDDRVTGRCDSVISLHNLLNAANQMKGAA